MRTRLLLGLLLIPAAAGCRSRCGSVSNDRCDSRYSLAPASRPAVTPTRSAEFGVPIGYPATYSPVSYAPQPTVTYGPPAIVTPIPPAPVPPVSFGSPPPANELPFPNTIPSPGVPTGPANQLPPPAGFGK